MNELICPWEDSTYLFFSSNVPSLIHYSHAVAIISALSISFLIFVQSPRNTVSRLILLFMVLFSFWVVIDVILWATNKPSVVMFYWALQVLIEPLASAIAFYILYLYLFKQWPRFYITFIIFVLLLPLLIFLPTKLDLTGLLLSTCESIEGPLAKYYTYTINLIFLIAILIMGFARIPKITTKSERIALISFTVGLITFLMTFSSGNLISSFTDDWTTSQYGLFGMPLFASLIAYSIVKFKAFNVHTVGAEILIFILAVIVLSLGALQHIENVRMISAITFILVCILGTILVKSVKKEILQREQITKLATELQNANLRLKDLDKMKTEFVSIASHQLRSPLTSIRGYTSMLLEGSYGKLPVKAVEVISKISDSSKYMALSIEDYLNVSRIEAGNMKYEMSDFNAKELVEKIVDEMRPIAIKKGLVMVFRSDCNGSCMIHADIGKTRQIVMNLLDNSMKYTPKGSITVVVHDDVKKKILTITVQDTGVGMSQETMETLFEKFVRAKNANCVNVTGTGLGLYVARKMVTEMGAKIWMESEGEGKGSMFHVEFALLPGKPKVLK